jgi:hypothetical protein
VAWGHNDYGQCNVPSPNTGFVAVAGGYEHSLGLKADGSIVAWGSNEYGQCNVPSPNTDFVAVAGGWYHSLGLKVSAPPICRGDLNCDGQIDFGDINPFVLYLSKFNVWQDQHLGCNPKNGDINGDGVYGQGSFGDINPFVTLLCSAPLPIPCD